MNIDFTDQERQLLHQSVLTSSYPGQLALMVLEVLAKLRGPDEADPSDGDAGGLALHVED